MIFITASENEVLSLHGHSYQNINTLPRVRAKKLARVKTNSVEYLSRLRSWERHVGEYCMATSDDFAVG